MRTNGWEARVVSTELPVKDRPESEIRMSPDDVRAHAIATLRRKRKFWGDLAGFVGVNGVLWLIWALSDRSGDPIPWPAWVSAIWGFLLLLDGIRAFGSWPGDTPITEAEIDREVERRTRSGPPGR